MAFTIWNRNWKENLLQNCIFNEYAALLKTYYIELNTMRFALQAFPVLSFYDSRAVSIWGKFYPRSKVISVLANSMVTVSTVHQRGMNSLIVRDSYLDMQMHMQLHRASDQTSLESSGSFNFCRNCSTVLCFICSASPNCNSFRGPTHQWLQ